METKDDLIRAIWQKLPRLLNKYASIEESPVQFDADVEMTPKEVHTIQAVGEREPINVTDLAEHFGVTKSAASQMVAKLTEKGFLSKRHAAGSNKELELTLTPLGWRAFRAHEEAHGKHLEDLAQRLEAFSLSQIATASVFLDVIEDVVDDRLTQLRK